MAPRSQYARLVVLVVASSLIYGGCGRYNDEPKNAGGAASTGGVSSASAEMPATVGASSSVGNLKTPSDFGPIVEHLVLSPNDALDPPTTEWKPKLSGSEVFASITAKGVFGAEYAVSATSVDAAAALYARDVPRHPGPLPSEEGFKDRMVYVFVFRGIGCVVPSIGDAQPPREQVCDILVIVDADSGEPLIEMRGSGVSLPK